MRLSPFAILLTFASIAPTSLLTADPMPPAGAPAEDRVGFPKDYQQAYEILRTKLDAQNGKFVTVYGNDKAASVKALSALPYPNGSILVMETASIAKDAQGKMLTDEKGAPRKDKVLGLHVMRREAGFGAEYGSNRTGEWEYVEYRADGTHLTPPQKSAACAACHVKAGPERDFVQRGRFAPAEQKQ